MHFVSKFLDIKLILGSTSMSDSRLPNASWCLCFSQGHMSNAPDLSCGTPERPQCVTLTIELWHLTVFRTAVTFTLHLSLNRGGQWGTTDDFKTSFLCFFLFSTALWDLANSRPVHSLMLSSHLFLLSALSSSSVHCALQGGFGQTWWTGDMTIPLQEHWRN